MTVTSLVRVALGAALAGALAVPSAHAQAPDRAKTLRAAADALGMGRWSDIGGANTRLPGIDIVNTQELAASGTADDNGRMVKADLKVALGYNPAGMRIEMTRTPDGGRAEHTIHTVRETWAWDESQIGAGLVAGKGTATPAMAAVRQRLLNLWTLPFGVVKAAYAAGDKTVVSTEGGATVITAPLSGPLAGMSVKATLDANNLITKVEARADNPALADLAMQMEYSDYKDHAVEVLTDVKTPGRIVEKRGGRTIVDLTVKSWETNNPYVVFPVPANVKAASASSPTSR
jgi:hypothetical protein